MLSADHFLVAGGPLATLVPGAPILDVGAVRVQAGLVAETGPAAALRERHPELPVYDVGGRLILPGFIDAHMHFYSQLAVGLAGAPADDFVGVLRGMWWRLDRALTPDAVYLSAWLALTEGLRRGVTTVIDHHASPGAIEGSLGLIERAAREVGVRVNLCYEVTDRGGPAEAEAGIAENVRHLARCRELNDPLVTGSFGLHASFTLEDETLRRAVAAAAAAGVGCHIHVAEDAADLRDALQRSGKRTVARLAAAGVLGPRSIAAHCVHVDAHERRILAETGTFVVHNPESNLNNAVGAADLEALLDAGIPVGLGTDGMTADVLLQARTAMLVRRHVLRDPKAGFGAAVQLLLEGSARVASALVGVPLGRLEPGAPADIAIPDHVPFTPLSSENLGGHLLFGVQRTPMHAVFVAGRLRLAGGALVDLDERARRNEALTVARQVWKRFGELS